jgi:hypothetical protein
VENQPDIAEVLSKIFQKEPLDIIPIEISAVTDPVLIAQDENSSIEENNEASEELLLSISPLAQHRSISSSGSPELELPAVKTVLSWTNNSRPFDDVLLRQWHYKWAWPKTLNTEKLIPLSLWEKNLDDVSLLKAMFGTLQSILCVVMPEFVQWSGKSFERYDQLPQLNDIKLFISKTAVQLCLFTAYSLWDIDLLYRIPMFYEYMATMGLGHMIDGTYNRLMYIKLFNDPESTRYVYIMTTLYDQKTNCVHWTEG